MSNSAEIRRRHWQTVPGPWMWIKTPAPDHAIKLLSQHPDHMNEVVATIADADAQTVRALAFAWQDIDALLRQIEHDHLMLDAVRRNADSLAATLTAEPPTEPPDPPADPA